MDLHPILVHVPIAFLSFYSVLELFSIFKGIRKSSTVFNLKSFLLAIGFIGAVIAAAAGDNARFLNSEFLNPNLVELHEEFAGATEAVFAILTVIYFTMIVTRYRDIRMYLSKFSLRLTALIEKCGVFFFKHFYITVILALIGLVLVSITGALGGALVYGSTSKDPFINATVKYICGDTCK